MASDNTPRDDGRRVLTAPTFVEADLEDVVLDYFEALDYEVVHGPEIAPGGSRQERATLGDVFLLERMRRSLARINPDLNDDQIGQVIATVRRAESQSLTHENLRIHQLMRQGVPIEVVMPDGSHRTRRANLVDFIDPGANDWLAVNQFVVVEERRTRRADVVVFLNGMPVVVFELKSPTDEKATIKKAYNQIQTYKAEVPSLFLANAFCVISDGPLARAGTITGGFEYFAPWRSIDEAKPADKDIPAIEVMVRGALQKRRFLDLLQNFIDWSNLKTGLSKRLAKYNQFWAVNAAVRAIVTASAPGGDRRGGVVWHTQGSGKSFEMLLAVNKLMREPAMSNPTVVLLTDRNDLDNQLFDEEFAPSLLLPEAPRQAESRTNLRELLNVGAGGIVFTTIQKFGEVDGDPVLSDRRNVVVIADEAHRTQYGLLEGFAANMRAALPNATFIGFSGTPIELADRSTSQVFGDYISRYTPAQSIEDGATVPVFYERRLVKVKLTDDDTKAIDETFAALTDDLSEEEQAKLGTRWTRMEKILGTDERITKVAEDFLAHWEPLRSQLFGKALLVVSSRSIASTLYDKIVEMRPDWHSEDDAQGRIKVVYTGSAADLPRIRRHVRTKEDLDAVKGRFTSPADPLEVVIVCDLLLTGFNCPPLHTMYVDKPLKGHGLFQAITRVNRPFLNKPGGLIVDYFGITDELARSVARYGEGDQPAIAIDTSEVVRMVIEKREVVASILHGRTWRSDPTIEKADRFGEITRTANFVLANEDRKRRFVDQTLALVKAHAIVSARDEVRGLHADIVFFSAVRSVIMKLDGDDSDGDGTVGRHEALETAIGQLVSSAIVADEVLDIFTVAGMAQPEVSLLSEAFLDKLSREKQRNLAIELLRRLLNDEIRSLGRTNVVQHRLFSDLLTGTILRYQNKTLTDAEVIVELVELARTLRDEHERLAASGLTEEELAFYDAVSQNDAAVLQLGDDILRTIVRELVELMQKEATVDWRYRETVRASMRVKIKRLLRKYGYPPDKQAAAVDLVIEQAELFADELTAA